MKNEATDATIIFEEFVIIIRASIVGLLAQLVERYTGIAEVMGLNPVRA